MLFSSKETFDAYLRVVLPVKLINQSAASMPVRPIRSRLGLNYDLTNKVLNKFAKFHELWPSILTF